MRIQAAHIRCTRIRRNEPSREVFGDLTLSISPGECVGVIGREGSGKTTLLGLLGGLIEPAGGSILLDGVDLHGRVHEAKALRLRLGYTFQFPEEQFLSPTVAGEFDDVLRLRGVPREEWGTRMHETLRTMGFDSGTVADRSPFSLSLGESRRLALSLLLAVRPDAAFLDEPTAGLDAPGVVRSLNVLRGLRDRGVTLVIATHDVDFLAECASRVLILGGGGIAAEGKAGEMLADNALLGRHGYAAPVRLPPTGDRQAPRR